MQGLLDFPEDDPLPPHQRHSPTSRDAAEAILPRTGSLRRVVLDAIRQAGADGLTDEEGIDATGLSPSTYRPRRVECCEMGFVGDRGLRRRTRSGRQAVAWCVTSKEAAGA